MKGVIGMRMTDKEFEQFIQECNEHNKKMMEECFNQRLQNAYIRGKADLVQEPFWEMDTDIQKIRLDQEYIKGQLERLVIKK